VTHRSRPNLSAAWQICGEFLLIGGRSRFFEGPRAATLRSRLCRKEICAIRFASSLPQDSPAQLMFGLAGFGDAA
jgi:hypothetical protein